MLNADLFTGDPITAIITYPEVMRDQNTFILKLITTNKMLRKQFDNYLNLRRFDSQSDEHNHVKILTRPTKNLLEWLAKKEFDYESNYNKLYDKYPHMFEDSAVLDMYRTVCQIINESFVKKIFIYSPARDKRIMYDIVKTFGKNSKLTYVTGHYLDAATAIGKIDLFVDSDLERMSPLMLFPQYKHSIFMVAKYGYNYEKDPLSKNDITLKNGASSLAAKKQINLLEFTPFKVTKEALRNG